MSVSVQIGEADRPLATAAQCLGWQTHGDGQFVAPQRTRDGNTALTGKNHISGVQIHENPQADGAEHFIAAFIIGHHGPRIGYPRGWHGPGFDVDMLTELGHPGDLHLVPGYDDDPIIIPVKQRPTSVVSVRADGKDDVRYYDLTGRRVVNPTRGIYISNGKKIMIK